MPFPLIVKFEVAGEVQFRRQLIGVHDSVKTIKPALEQISDDFRATEQKQFSQEGAFEGNEHWQALLPGKYREWKKKHYPGMPILQLHGNLMKSLTQKDYRSEVGGSVENITDMSLEIGTDVSYAICHQVMDEPGRKMPVRKPISLTEAQKKRWVRYIRQFIRKQINQGVLEGSYGRSLQWRKI